MDVYFYLLSIFSDWIGESQFFLHPHIQYLLSNILAKARINSINY